MTLLKIIWEETLGMFVDDGALALQAAVLIAAIAASVKLLSLHALLGGMLLLVGYMVVLAPSLLQKTRGR